MTRNIKTMSLTVLGKETDFLLMGILILQESQLYNMALALVNVTMFLNWRCIVEQLSGNNGLPL